MTKLAENRKQIIQVHNDFQTLEDLVAQLPKIDEQLGIYKSLGIEEKLKAIPVLEKSKRLLQRATKEEGVALKTAIESLKDNYPDTTFLSDTALENLPQADAFRKIREELNRLQPFTEGLLAQWKSFYEQVNENIKFNPGKYRSMCLKRLLLKLFFKELPTRCREKWARKEGWYQKLLQDTRRINPASVKGQ
jgi:hypothetical protein